MDISEAAVEGVFTLALAFLAVRMIHRDSRISEILVLSLIAVLIDIDHLLPTYSAGIKAFHSIIFISAVSFGIISCGHLMKSRRIERIGVSAYMVSFLAISLDLLEGGRINFLYPMSGDSYVLSGRQTYATVLLTALICIALITSYFLELFLGEDKSTVLRADPHTGQTS